MRLALINGHTADAAVRRWSDGVRLALKCRCMHVSHSTFQPRWDAKHTQLCTIRRWRDSLRREGRGGEGMSGQCSQCALVVVMSVRRAARMEASGRRARSKQASGRRW